ncbi:MAG: thioredoxin [bacterium]
MADIFEFTDSNFNEEVLNSGKPVLVDFWADWCGPCHMLAPTIKELAQEFQHKIKVGKLNTDINFEVASRYGIQSIPTLILFSGGKEVARMIGVRPKHDIVQVINQHLQAVAMA